MLCIYVFFFHYKYHNSKHLHKSLLVIVHLYFLEEALLRHLEEVRLETCSIQRSQT